MKPTTIRLSDEHRKALDKLTTKYVNFSDHIRRAIDKYLSTPSIQASLAASSPKKNI